MRKSPRSHNTPCVGDVLSIRLNRHHVGYFQFTHVDKQKGDVIRVFNDIHDKNDIPNFTTMVNKRERFYACFLVRFFCDDISIKVVSHQKIPTRCRRLPTFRVWYPNTRNNGWIWFHSGERSLKHDSPLTKRHRNLPIAEQISPRHLAHRIRTGWKPCDEW